MAAVSLLLLIVCLGPLPFGSVLVRERAVLQICAFLALALTLTWRPLRAPCSGPALAVAAVGLWGLLQSLPWPRPLALLLAAGIVERWDQATLLLGADPGAVPPSFVPLSLAPDVSRAIGLHWLAAAAGFLAASRVGTERRSRRLLVAGFLAMAIFEVVHGTRKWFARSGTMWGLEVAGETGRLRGTFVNPDHLAFYLMLAVTAVLAWLWWSSRRLLGGGPAEQRLLLVVPPIMVFLVLFAGVAFTGSRAGLVAVMLALLFQALLLAAHYRRWQVGLVAAGAVVLGLGGVALFGFQRGLGRWLTISAYEVTWNTRFQTYAASWDLWGFSPWTGTGLGTFRQAFPMVQPADLGGTWVHAHSDVLELLMTTGVVGLPVLALGLIALCRRLFVVFRRGRRSEDRAVALAGLGAVAGAVLHSVVDFGLTVPANAFTLAVICGLACGAHTARRRSERRSPSKPLEEASQAAAGER